MGVDFRKMEKMFHAKGRNGVLENDVPQGQTAPHFPREHDSDILVSSNFGGIFRCPFTLSGEVVRSVSIFRPGISRRRRGPGKMWPCIRSVWITTRPHIIIELWIVDFYAICYGFYAFFYRFSKIQNKKKTSFQGWCDYIDSRPYFVHLTTGHVEILLVNLWWYLVVRLYFCLCSSVEVWFLGVKTIISGERNIGERRGSAPAVTSASVGCLRKR